MQLARQDIYIRAGSTEIFTITVKNDDGSAADCTSAVLRGQIRASAQDSTVLANFSCTWTNAAGGIGKGVLDATSSAALGATGVVCTDTSKRVYDFEVAWITGEVDRVSNGYAIVSPEVTR